MEHLVRLCRVAILCGATAWRRRLRPRIAELVPNDPRGLRRVPTEPVQQVESENQRSCSSPEAALQKAATGSPAPFRSLPIDGWAVVDGRGKRVARIREVVAQPGGREATSVRHRSPPARCSAARGLLQRAGFFSEDELQEGTKVRPDDEGNLQAGRQ
jgi:hypothetical protein